MLLSLHSLLLPGCVDSVPGATDLRRRPAGESSELHTAVKAGNRAEVERLLDEGGDIEAKPFEMYSAPPLHFAALAGDLDQGSLSFLCGSPEILAWTRCRIRNGCSVSQNR